MHANGLVAHLLVPRDILKRIVDVFSVGVGIDHQAFTALAAQQVVDRRVERLALDVP